jgi:hypothetical protein
MSSEIPEYSTSIEQALKVVDEVMKKKVSVFTLECRHSNIWWASFKVRTKAGRTLEVSRYAETPAHAICLAGLEAIEVECD